MKVRNKYGIVSIVSEKRAKEMIAEGGVLIQEVGGTPEKKASKKASKKSEGTPQPKEDSKFEDKTDEELKEIAKEKGVKGYAVMKRETLIKKLS